MDSLSFGQNNTRTNCQSCSIQNNYNSSRYHYFFILQCAEHFFRTCLFNLIFFIIENDKLHGYVCDCKIYGVQQMQLRRLKTDTPRDKKDAKYYEKRKRNNMAAKKSREAKRRRDNEVSYTFICFFKYLFILFKHLSYYITRPTLSEVSGLRYWMKRCKHFI